MKKVLLALLLLVGVSLHAQEISIIPKPAEMQIEEGEFLFDGKVVVCYPEYGDKAVGKVIDGFVEELKATTGIKLKKSTPKKEKLQNWEVTKYSKKADAHIVIYIDEYMAEEEYKLSVTPKRIDYTAQIKTIKPIPRNMPSRAVSK